MKIGLSLAMNSAPSEITNRTRKIHNDQKPRLLALKLRQRRALIGDSSKSRAGPARPSGPAGSMSGRSSGAAGASAPGAIMSSVRSLASTSHLPRREINARIDPRIGEVGDQRHDQADECEDIDVGEHHRIVAVEHAFEAEQAEAVERE